MKIDKSHVTRPSLWPQLRLAAPGPAFRTSWWEKDGPGPARLAGPYMPALMAAARAARPPAPMVPTLPTAVAPPPERPSWERSAPSAFGSCACAERKAASFYQGMDHDRDIMVDKPLASSTRRPSPQHGARQAQQYLVPSVRGLAGSSPWSGTPPRGTTAEPPFLAYARVCHVPTRSLQY